MESSYVLRGRVARPLTIAMWVLALLAVAGLVWFVVGLVTQSPDAALGIALALLTGPEALTILYVTRRAAAAALRLDLAADGMALSSARGREFVRWGDVERVAVRDSSARFFLRDGVVDRPGASVVLTYPGEATTPEWHEIQADIAARLDADRGYQHRICDLDAVAEAPGATCGELECAGSDTCQLHALKQARA